MQDIKKVAWIEIRNRKVLYARTRGQTLFYNAGGKLHEGETDEEALIREILEEFSAKIVRGTSRYLESFAAQAHGKPEGTLVKVICYTAESEGELQPTSEIEELAWFTTADRERTTVTGKLILDWLKKHDLID